MCYFFVQKKKNSSLLDGVHKDFLESPRNRLDLEIVAS